MRGVGEARSEGEIVNLLAQGGVRRFSATI